MGMVAGSDGVRILYLVFSIKLYHSRAYYTGFWGESQEERVKGIGLTGNQEVGTGVTEDQAGCPRLESALQARKIGVARQGGISLEKVIFLDSSCVAGQMAYNGGDVGLRTDECRRGR